MQRLVIVVGLVVAMAGIATAQDGKIAPVIAGATEQARMKPLVDAETKAREALLAKAATLPQSAAVKAATEARDKAVAELDKATKALPEYQEWLKANAEVGSTAYQIMADHKLSSLIYQPELNDKRELVFSGRPKP